MSPFCRNGARSAICLFRCHSPLLSYVRGMASVQGLTAVMATSWFITLPKQLDGTGNRQKTDDPHGNLTRCGVEFESQTFEHDLTFGLPKKHNQAKRYCGGDL